MFANVKALNDYTPKNNPKTVVEKAYAEEYVRNVPQTGPDGGVTQKLINQIADKQVDKDSKERIRSATDVLLTTEEIGKRGIMWQEVAKKHAEDQAEKVKGEGWSEWLYEGSKKNLVPFYDWYQTHNAIPGIADYPYIDLTFDKATGRFGVKPTAEGIRIANAKGLSLGGSVMDKIERFMGDRLTNKIEALNKSIDTIRPVLQGDNYDAANEIRSLTMHFGEHSDQKTNGVWNSMLKAIGRTEAKNPEDIEFGGTHPNFTQASGGNGSSGGKLSTETDITEQLKASFAEGESNNDYNRLVDTPTHPKRTNLTDMTIGEVLDFQKGMLRAGNPSSAAGKYQIVSTTLKSLVREGVVKMDDKYDANTQERLADALLERRGLNDFMAGKLPARQFLKRLGNEWEIIKKSPTYAKRVIAELEKD